jgi:hypothetical protein
MLLFIEVKESFDLNASVKDPLFIPLFKIALFFNYLLSGEIFRIYCYSAYSSTSSNY